MWLAWWCARGRPPPPTARVAPASGEGEITLLSRNDGTAPWEGVGGVSESERWARTQDEIDLVYVARNHGRLCADCGRRLEPGETVYIERFVVGPRRTGWRSHNTYRLAPVGAECAGADLVDGAQSAVPEFCAWCERRVVYRAEHDRPRQRAICSTQCRQLAMKAAKENQHVSEGSGDRL